MIGVGNSWRGDDAAGLEVARRLGGIEHEGDCTRLIEEFAEAEEVVIVDAASSGVPPGTIHRFEADALPTGRLRSSTHAFGVPEAIQLARALDRLPPRVTVYAIEGKSFAAGERLSAPVERAVEKLVGELI